MSETEKRAKELWLSSIKLENSFKPISEAKLAERLNAEGYKASSSAIGRWKVKYGWEDAKELIVQSAASGGDKQVQNIVRASGLKAMVENLSVDIERTNNLTALSIEIMEIEGQRILRRMRGGWIDEDGKKVPPQEISKEDKDFIIKAAQTSFGMKQSLRAELERMPRDVPSSEVLLEMLNSVDIEREDIIEVETEGENGN